MLQAEWRGVGVALRRVFLWGSRMTAPPKVTVRMLTGLAGRPSADAGDVVALDQFVALRMIAKGYAEHIDFAREPEATTVGAPERATRTRAKGRTRKAVTRG